MVSIGDIFFCSIFLQMFVYTNLASAILYNSRYYLIASHICVLFEAPHSFSMWDHLYIFIYFSDIHSTLANQNWLTSHSKYNNIPAGVGDSASSLGQSHASAYRMSLTVSSNTISYSAYVVILGVCLRFKLHWMFQI